MVHMEEFLWKRYMEDMEHVFLDALAFVSDQHRVVLAKALTAIFAEDAPFELSDENILVYLNLLMRSSVRYSSSMVTLSHVLTCLCKNWFYVLTISKSLYSNLSSCQCSASCH